MDTLQAFHPSELKTIVDAITEQTSKAIALEINATLSLHKEAVSQYMQELRSQISMDDVQRQAVGLIKSDELRKEIYIQSTYLHLDLYNLQSKVWVQLLNDERARLDEVLGKQKIEIKAAQERLKVIRDVEIAEMEKAKKEAEQDFDLTLYRIKKTKIHLIVAVLLIAFAFVLGQKFAGNDHGINTRAPRKIEKVYVDFSEREQSHENVKKDGFKGASSSYGKRIWTQRAATQNPGAEQRPVTATQQYH